MIKTVILKELGDTPVRARYEMTIPKGVRDVLKLNIGDILGYDLYENGKICVYKVIKHKLRNGKTCVIENNGERDGNERNNSHS